MFRWFGQQSRKGKQDIKLDQPDASPDLTVRASVVRETSPDSLRALLKAAIVDAEQIATSIRAKAQAEAEAEAAKIIAQAQVEARALKDNIESEARKQAEDIVSTARRRAEVTEIEVRQKALQFLISASDEVGKAVSEEYMKAYSRLASSLQNLMSEGQNVEMELKGKVIELQERTSLMLKGYEATFLGTSGAAVSPVETPSTETESKQLTADKENVKRPIAVEKEVLVGEVKEPTQIQKMPPEKKTKKFFSLGGKSLWAKGKEPLFKRKVVEKKIQPTQLDKEVEKLIQPQEEEASKEKMEASIQVEKVTDIPEPVKEVKEVPSISNLREENNNRQKSEHVAVSMDSQALYTGEVELTIAPPLNLNLVSRLYNYLQTVPELKILYTQGSWDQGTTITVVPDKPMPLINFILKTPGVEVIPELLEKESQPIEKPGAPRGSGKRLKRIKLTLSEAIDNAETSKG